MALQLLPQISISLAAPQEPEPEPFSPFSPGAPPTPTPLDDGFRPALLTPPPTLSPRFPRQLSPLRPADAPVAGQGLERDRFEALLKASRERNAAVGAKKALDLRKEIAIKAHKSKQVERRALFLSKVQAPPSPTATLTPKTPPESPAVFHYSLPSPGLASPLTMFESIEDDADAAPRQSWVEQVDFRIPGHPNAKLAPPTAKPVSRGNQLPSLDQITARLSGHGYVVTPATAPLPKARRLPAFLQTGTRSPPREPSPPAQGQAAADPVTKPRRAPPAAVGRLQFPVRTPSPPSPTVPEIEIQMPSPRLPPASPLSPLAPKLQVTTTVVPRTCSVSPTKFTESNLSALNSRERTAKDMLSRLQQRTRVRNTSTYSATGREKDDEERALRRRSAPPELPQRLRASFANPVLQLPGAF